MRVSVSLLIYVSLLVGCSANHGSQLERRRPFWNTSEGWLLAAAAIYPDQAELDQAASAPPASAKAWVPLTAAICNQWHGPKPLREFGALVRPRLGNKKVAVAELMGNQYTFHTTLDFRVFDIEVDDAPCVRVLVDARLSDADVSAWLLGTGSAETGALLVYALRPSVYPGFIDFEGRQGGRPPANNSPNKF